MSRFFPGQRVRIVRCYEPLLMHLIGVETKIVGESPYNPTQWQLDVPVPVGAGPRCIGVSAPEECLEPILPEGAAPSEFESLRDLLNELEGMPA